MSAFGGKADVNHWAVECLLIAISGLTDGGGLLVRVPFTLAPAVQPIGVLGRGARQVLACDLGCQPQGQNQKTQAKQVRHARDCTRKCAARQDETRQHFQDAFLHGSSFPPVASREYRRGPEIGPLCGEERTLWLQMSAVHPKAVVK